MKQKKQTSNQKTMFKYAGTICDETGDIVLHVSNSPTGAKNLNSYKPKMLELPYSMFPKECQKYVSENEFFTEYERAIIKSKIKSETDVDMMQENLKCYPETDKSLLAITVKYTPNSVFDLGRTTFLSKR